MEVLFPVLGLCFGSFATVLIDRVPRGRSQCLQCKRVLTVTELIPVVSFFLQRGRCRGCSSAIGWLCPTLEIGSAVLFFLALTVAPSIDTALLLALSLWFLLVIAVIDYRTQTIDDRLNIPLLLVALLYNKFTGTFDLSGALLGITFFGLLWFLSRGRWIGSGDILLAAGIGMLLGSWQMMVACLLMTYSIAALIVSTLLLCRKVSRGTFIAFAPFFALGTLLTIIMQERIALLIALYL